MQVNAHAGATVPRMSTMRSMNEGRNPGWPFRMFRQNMSADHIEMHCHFRYDGKYMLSQGKKVN
jgi:hypothetical protein